MRTPFQKALRRTSILHAVLIAFALVWPLVASVFQDRKDKSTQLVMIDMKSAMTTARPQVARNQDEPKEEPRQPDPPKPKDAPKPPPDKDAMPDLKPAPRTNTLVKAKEIKLSTNVVNLAKLNKPAAKPNAGPKLTDKQIRDLLAQGIKLGDTTSLYGDGINKPELFSIYYAQVREAMYDAWQQPASLAGAGLVAQVRIKVMKDGSIASRSMIRPSGQGLMDDSVMKAVNSVSRLRPLPAGYSGYSKDITVDFELTGAGF